MKNRYKVLMFTLTVVILMVTYFYSEAADITYGGTIVNEVVSVYDGDTFKVNMQCWPTIIGKNMSVRIYGIDTPEIRGTSGVVKGLALDAKEMASFYLLASRTVELRNMRRGKYFRIIADVYVDGENLGDILIKEGLAKPYYGGKRPVW